MKKNYKFLFSLMVIAIALLSGIAASFANDDVVASVDGTDITAAEFSEAAKYQRFELIQQYNNYVQMSKMYGIPIDEAFNKQFFDMLDGDSRKDFGKTVVNQLVYNKVLEKEAEKANITVTDQEVTDQLMKIFGIKTQEPTAASESTLGLGSSDVTGMEPEVNKELELQKIIDEYFATVVQGAFTKDYFRGLIRMMLIESKLQNEVIFKDHVFEDEMVSARHILVETSELANEIVNKIKAGDDWAMLAAQYSIDTGNKDNGGDLGWFGKGVMVLPFEEAVFAMNPGDISDPVKTDFGYHIIALDKKEMRPLEGDALSNAQFKLFQEWYDNVTKEMAIETFDNWEALIPTEPVFTPVEIQPTDVPDASAETAEEETPVTETVQPAP